MFFLFFNSCLDSIPAMDRIGNPTQMNSIFLNVHYFFSFFKFKFFKNVMYCKTISCYLVCFTLESIGIRIYHYPLITGR